MEKNMESFSQLYIQDEDVHFRHPFTMIISGSTGSGKSQWLQRFFKNFQTLTRQPIMGMQATISEVIYCYGELNPSILNMQKNGKIGDGSTSVIVHSGMPTEDLIRAHALKTNGHSMWVLDDLMVGIGKQQDFLDSLFTKTSHNLGISVILITQHLFAKELRIARNNAHYIVLMRNPAGALQVRTLAVQLFPTRTKYFLEAYADATRKNFGYLITDMHPFAPELIRLRTNIYPDDPEPITIYMEK